MRIDWTHIKKYLVIQESSHGIYEVVSIPLANEDDAIRYANVSRKDSIIVRITETIGGDE